jgi:hypothetical protein
MKGVVQKWQAFGRFCESTETMEPEKNVGEGTPTCSKKYKKIKNYYKNRWWFFPNNLGILQGAQGKGKRGEAIVDFAQRLSRRLHL